MLSKKELIHKLNKIKLIVSDVDGTLTNSKNELGELTKELVPKLASKGIKITFATQRTHSSILDYAKCLNVSVPILSVNGALIKDLNGFILSKSVIPTKKVISSIELADQNFIRIAFVHEEDIVYTEHNSVLHDFLFRLGTNYKLVESYDDYLDNVLEIIMMGNEKQVIKHIQKKMNFPLKLFLDAKYYRSSSKYGVYHLEIRKSGTSKKTGLIKVAKHLKLKKENIAVLGDWYNDRDLFEFGGTNVALQNAVPELKNKADYITKATNDEDGVGEFLKIIYDSV